MRPCPCGFPGATGAAEQNSSPAEALTRPSNVGCSRRPACLRGRHKRHVPFDHKHQQTTRFKGNSSFAAIKHLQIHHGNSCGELRQYLYWFYILLCSINAIPFPEQMRGKVTKVTPFPFLRGLQNHLGGSCSFPHVEGTAPSFPHDNLGLMCLLCKGHRGVMRVKTVQNDSAVTLNQMSVIKRGFKSGLWERKSSHPPQNLDQRCNILLCSKAFHPYLRVKRIRVSAQSSAFTCGIKANKSGGHQRLLDLPSGVPTTCSDVQVGSLLSGPAFTGMATAVLETTGGLQRGMWVTPSSSSSLR